MIQLDYKFNTVIPMLEFCTFILNAYTRRNATQIKPFVFVSLALTDLLEKLRSPTTMGEACQTIEFIAPQLIRLLLIYEISSELYSSEVSQDLSPSDGLLPDYKPGRRPYVEITEFILSAAAQSERLALRLSLVAGAMADKLHKAIRLEIASKGGKCRRICALWFQSNDSLNTSVLSRALYQYSKLFGLYVDIICSLGMGRGTGAVERPAGITRDDVQSFASFQELLQHRYPEPSSFHQFLKLEAIFENDTRKMFDKRVHRFQTLQGLVSKLHLSASTTHRDTTQITDADEIMMQIGKSTGDPPLGLSASFRHKCEVVDEFVADKRLYLPTYPCCRTCGSTSTLTGIDFARCRAFRSRESTPLLVMFTVAVCTEDTCGACGRDALMTITKTEYALDRPRKEACNAKKTAAPTDETKERSEQINESLVAVREVGVLVKTGSRIGLEEIIAQLFVLYAHIFEESAVSKSHVGALTHYHNLKALLTPFTVVQTSANTGLTEYLPNVKSLHEIKTSLRSYSDTCGSCFCCINGECCPGAGVPLKEYFLQHYEPLSETEHCGAYNAAKLNFIRSLAPNLVLIYLLDVKDRHNGNILLHSDGRIVHVDYAFALGQIPGGQCNPERLQPCCITPEMIDMLDGCVVIEDGCSVDSMSYFKWMLRRCFLAARSRCGFMEEWLKLSFSYQVFELAPDLTDIAIDDMVQAFRQRHWLDMQDEEVTTDLVYDRLVSCSLRALTCCSQFWDLYGVFQWLSNGIRR